MGKNAWLMFIYQIPALPSTHRAYAWRKLKSLGALYLQNSICLLPTMKGMEEKLKTLRDEIAERGGQAQLFHVDWPKTSEEQDLIGRMKAQSDDEYDEFLEKCVDFHAELRKERDRNHLTFGELEENEAELQKLRSWLPRVKTRDFFGATRGDVSVEALAECEKDFSLFESQIEKADEGGLTRP